MRHNDPQLGFTNEQLEYLDREIHKRRWKGIATWIVLFTSFVIFMFASFQHSRKTSCERTYTSFPQMFKPFFPKGHITPKQQENLNKLHNRANVLASNCKAQVKWFNW